MFRRNGNVEVGFSGRRVKVEVHPVTDGTTLLRYEVVSVRDAVAVLAVSDDGDYVLLRHRRFAVDQECKNPGIIEVCAGVVDHDDICSTSMETAFRTASRELHEETGYSAASLSYYGSFYTSPGILTERIHLVVAHNLVAGEQALEETEKGEIEILHIPKNEAWNMFLRGEIVDMKTAMLIMRHTIETSNGNCCL